MGLESGGIQYGQRPARPQAGPAAGMPEENGPRPEDLLPGAKQKREKEEERTGRFDGFGQKKECETCKNRKYQDGSDDSTVSFQAPTKISVQEAAAKVASHEREHVFHEQSRAKMEGRKVIHQSVSIHTSVCPECGTPYVSGGTTRTTTSGPDAAVKQKGGEEMQKGRYFDKTA